MNIKPDHVKLILGLKVKQIRLEKNLSLSELSSKSGLSASYINEIEKGKKYPKTDKIIALASAMEVDYDQLISLKLSRKLEPISQLLQSNFLTEIPFDFFGIDPATLLEMLSNAPTKLSAFINTIIKVAKSYSVSVEKFYFAVLRSYQEMHNNYFPNLEIHAEKFRKKHDINLSPNEYKLSEILKTEYGVEISTFSELEFPLLKNIRSVFVPKSKKLLINNKITADQRIFTLARELGFLYMKLSVRPLTSSWIIVNSFDEVFNNFQASYFAGALLIDKKQLINKTKELFAAKTFKENNIIEMINYFQTTPETLIQRLFSLLPQYFGIEKVFFMKFTVDRNGNNYDLTKELHLYKLHDPQENQNENYCRRWVSLNILDELSARQNNGDDGIIVDSQVSDYLDVGNKYFILSIAKSNSIQEKTNDSISFGFEIDENTLKKVRFLTDNEIKKQTVNQTCEKCSIFDCKERVAAPIKLQQKRHIKAMIEAIENLK